MADSRVTSLINGVIKFCVTQIKETGGLEGTTYLIGDFSNCEQKFYVENHHAKIELEKLDDDFCGCNIPFDDELVRDIILLTNAKAMIRSAVGVAGFIENPSDEERGAVSSSGIDAIPETNRRDVLVVQYVDDTKHNIYQIGIQDIIKDNGMDVSVIELNTEDFGWPQKPSNELLH